MRNKIASFLILILPLFLSAQSAPPLKDPKEFLDKLKEKSKRVSSIRADFTEEKFSSVFREPHRSTGVFYFKKENKMRWEKKSPDPYVFLVNGDKVRIKEGDKEKDISSFNQGVGHIKELMLALVNGEFTEYKGFVSEYSANDKSYFARLVPKNKRMANVFDYILLEFSRETLALRELDFFEKNGDKSLMKFTNEKVNTALDDSLFLDF